MSSIEDEVKNPNISAVSEDLKGQSGNASVQAALARTLTRGIALYFSRPVRLFRPSKVSGWQSLQGLATQHGTSMTPQYVLSLINRHGFIVIPKHFVPPMLVNAFLGTVLWTTYAGALDVIQPRINHSPHLAAALAGGIAGGAQALVAAPAENVRLVIEGGTGGSSWFHAWKEVFQGTRSSSISRQNNMAEIRLLRGWMKEVGDMAGRGWNGWGWGLGKDVCGFAAFFFIFEVTRQVALHVKAISQRFESTNNRESSQVPRIVQAMTLVVGGGIAGLTYESVCMPWDVARRTVQLNRITNASDGISSMFHNPYPPSRSMHDTTIRRRVYGMLKIVGRVGPWGVGFLVWEAYHTKEYK